MSSSPLGMAFGIAAALALVVVMLYSVRRSMPAVRRFGPTQRYLQIHLWGGAAFLVLFLLHSGFGIPSGLLAFLLWALSVWVVLTGAAGLGLQRLVPRVLEPASSFEVHLDRVPQLVEQLRTKADAAAARAEARVRAYYERELAPALAAPRMVTAVFSRTPGVPRRGTRELELLRSTLTAEEAAVLDELRALHATKHELDVHYTVQRILRGWLYLHLPVAVALLGLVALHIFFIIYF